ncbi:MAG TPA: YetF domain-containing protein [Sphingomicrobium sp.]|nr:YetF domain-containing protein [Sphingomicrobium sp.]
MPIELFGLDGALERILRGIVLTSLAVVWTLALVRIVGLRAFSKMTAFDFVATIATGSLIAQAGTRSDWLDYAQALAAIGAVFLMQWAFARLRLISEGMAKVISNEPRLLMRDGEFLEDAMRQSRVSRENILEKIRASSASSIDEVSAVVLETTGDMHVMTGDVDPRLMKGVRGWNESGDERQAEGDGAGQSR